MSNIFDLVMTVNLTQHKIRINLITFEIKEIKTQFIYNYSYFVFEPIYTFTQMELSVESLCKSFLKKTPKFEKKRKKKAEQLSIQTYPIIWSLHTQQIMHPGTKNLAIIKVYT